MTPTKCRLISYQKDKDESFCVFIDACLSFKIKPFIHSGKSLAAFIVINVSECKYQVRIFESSRFPASTACVRACACVCVSACSLHLQSRCMLIVL